ncbi:Uncharacterized protein PECH_003379 [Penicillium ucsense]|uniref:Nudix hydrolase domain-containing protein n=1 Tax=Penicillium ucsense TaxID=2839758 RepID=A0A8J8WBW0_9EURO|nr:Uncharacterized protein PECM_000189 [Penicillium ucsense]KAF7739402.1 Uncharacterized protein PECH_003379 [Penicillium ucsense]
MTDSKMQLEDWLDDLCVRFIINLPHEELESVERICFQVEEAQWFYEDFIRPLDPALPSLSLKAFSLRIFQHCPLMSQWSRYHHMAAFSEFLAYKTRVPVRGAILLNEEMDSVVLVKGWKKGANWSFPRGKINKGEPDLDCAIREVYEETGFDVRAANLIKSEDSVKSIEVTMREQHMRLFVFPGVPRDTHFEPRTRKEISKIEWYKLSELPTLRKNKHLDEGMAVANANKFYMVAPFLHPLKKWIAQQKRLAAKDQSGVKSTVHAGEYASMDESTNNAGIGTHGSAMGNLPGVGTATSTPDASAHIKQLLKIAEAQPETLLAQTSTSALPASAVDQNKADALLALLRTGTQRSPAPNVHEHGLPKAPGEVNSSLNQDPRFATNFFPGFPQQQQHVAPSGFMQRTGGQHLPEYQSSPNQVQSHVIQHQFPPVSGLSQGFGSPAYSSMPSRHEQPLQQPTAAPSRPAVAPFQRTGDPQFSEKTKPSRGPGAAVPPASELPPPKLTSHSLALLGFFKDGSKTPQASFPAGGSADTSGPATVSHATQERKTSLHQDGLLNLFKGARNTLAPQPAELSGHSVKTAPPSQMQIMQRPSAQPDNRQPWGSVRSGPSTNVVQASVNPHAGSGNPQSEKSSRSGSKRSPNGGSTRRSGSSRRDQHRASAQLSSPITILPRPQSDKRDNSTPAATVSTVSTGQPLLPQTMQPSAPAPPKPFQPQILRRSDKNGFHGVSSAAPYANNIDRRSSLGVAQDSAGLVPPANMDRRPSQTHAQKEALLSLFSKPHGSPSMGSAVELESTSFPSQPANVSGIVSPLSSMHLAGSGGSISRHGTPLGIEEPSTSGNRVSSPSNKAFLLSYLQGVTK